MMMNRGSLNDITPAVKGILVANIVIFLAINLSSGRVDLTSWLGMYLPGAKRFAIYQYVTHMFTHAELMHIFFNMFAVFMFGRILENVWGTRRFLFYYFVTGIGAALLHSLVSWYGYYQLQEAYQTFRETPDAGLFAEFVREAVGKIPASMTSALNEWSTNPELTDSYLGEAKSFCESALFQRLNIPMIGASGAVFGLLLAFGMLFPNTKLMLMFLPIPIKAKYFVIGYGAIELFYGLQNQSGDNVAHFAHLGGMLFGFFIVRYWRKHGNQFY
jgi:membrane associated rhomboid family serine protease